MKNLFLTIGFIAFSVIASAQTSVGPGPTITTTKKGDATASYNAGGVLVVKCATSQNVCCVIISGLTGSGGSSGTVDVSRKSYSFSSWTSAKDNTGTETMTFKDAALR
jgi:hypothetical protein